MVLSKYHWNITGHERILSQLENDIETNNVSHAYLFYGPEHVGKTTVAKKFAQILQCKNDMCGKCRDCQLIACGNHPDTLVSEGSESLSIETVRNLQDVFNKKTQSKYRILIISEMQRMSLPAQNACLKFLEEPPESTVLILTSSNYSSILETIMSRLRCLYFSVPQLAEEDSKLMILSQGRIGRMNQLQMDEDYKAICMEQLETIQQMLSTKDIAQRFALAEKLHEQSDLIAGFLDILEFYMRSYVKNIAEYEGIMGNIYLSEKECLSLLLQIDEVRKVLDKNVNKRLLLENLLLSF